MAKGNDIIVSNDPRGRQLEGYITGTPKPGTCLQIDVSEAVVGGRFTYEVFTVADGNRRPVIVLLPNYLQGVDATTAYVTGSRCFVYFPLPGDELNMIVANLAGTGDDHAVGEMLMIDSGTGKLIVESSPESEPFQLLEAITDPTADTLAWCLATGQ